MIPDPPTLAVFCGAALALLVVPGPAVLYIVASSIDGGRRADADIGQVRLQVSY